MPRRNAHSPWRLATLACTAALALLAPAAHAAPITLYAAGSLNAALSTVVSNFTASTGIAVNTRFAASGTLRMAIEGGASADLFANGFSPPAPVPEPAAATLFATALAGLAAVLRRRTG